HLERDLTARGASVRNFGLVWISGRRRGEELEFALRARALWDEVAADVPDVGFRPNGSITVLRDAAHVRVAQDVLAQPDAEERQFQLLEPDEVRAVNPALTGSFAAGLHCAADAAVEPRRAAAAVRARNAESPNYHWLPGRQVISLENHAVRDHYGDKHQGDVVLFCPGAAQGVSGFRPDQAPLRRVRLQMMETEPFAAEVTTSIADWDSLLYYPVFDVPSRADL